MKVEVDLKDLETIVYATAAIKQIEQALATRKRDPFTPPEQDYKAAHDNLVAAMNSARRANSGTLIDWNGDLSKEEVDFLNMLSINQKNGFVKEISADERLGVGGFQKSNPMDNLAAKGCVKIGQCVKGAIWPGATQADLKPTNMFAVMITSRGLTKLEEALGKLETK